MIAGLILAGGKSKRFGSDKRFYELNGKTFLEIACEKIRKVCNKNYIVVDKYFTDKQIDSGAFVILRDLEEGKGPLMGIYSALFQIPDEGCLVIPVDMPSLSISFLRYIKELTNFFDLVVTYSYEPLPLPGFYSKKLLPLISSILENGIFSIKSLVTQVENNNKLKVLKLSFDDIKRFGSPGQSLFNVNRAEDLEKLR